MRASIYSFLLALVLGCNVTAGTILKVSEEKQQVTLPCPRPVEGRATWSREINGSKVDLITFDGERDIRHNDPRKRYSFQADKFKSLVIHRANVSDSGTYFCNNEAAAELTVIPSGTIIRNATERTSITLQCPPGVGGSDGPTWSREVAGKQEQIRSPVSTVDKTLTITEVQLRDSGLYYCDGKPAVYLRVIKATTTPTPTTPTTPTSTPTTTTTTTPTTSTTTTTTTLPTATTTPTPTTTTTPPPPPPTTTTTTTTTTPPTTTTTTTTTTPTTTTTTTTTTTVTSEDQKTAALVLQIVVPVFLLVIVIIVCYLAWRRRCKTRENEEICPVYDEISEDSVCQPSNGKSTGPTNTYQMVMFPGVSTQNDPTYATISDLPRTANKNETSKPAESPYCLISANGNNTGSSQLTSNYYSSLEKPKVVKNEYD